MKKTIVLIIICLIAFVTPIGEREPVSAEISVVGDVIFGISLPDWAVTCSEAPVYSYPDGSAEIIGTLPGGELVRIREGSKNNEFAMIAIGEWVKTVDLCKAKK